MNRTSFPCLVLGAVANLIALSLGSAIGDQVATTQPTIHTTVYKSHDKIRDGSAAPDFTARDMNNARAHLHDYLGRNVVLVVYHGASCLRCAHQLTDLAAQSGKFAGANTVLLGLSSDAPETNRNYLAGEPDYAIRLLSDTNHTVQRLLGTYNLKDRVELHAVFLIDVKGILRWHMTGPTPFMDINFLVDQAQRLSRPDTHQNTTSP